MANCNICHGHRPADGAPWSLAGASLAGQLTPVERIEEDQAALDGARLFFRYAEMLPAAIVTTFPGGPKAHRAQEQVLAAHEKEARATGRLAEADMWKQANLRLTLLGRRYPKGHPMAILDDARPPQPEGVDGRYSDSQLDHIVSNELRANRGYINNPIPFPYLRAPYLHNASVPSLRQLIGLDPRPERFCRGDNRYDPAALGLIAPVWEKPTDCPPDLAFAFDARQPGNGNKGHYHPWPPEEAGAHSDELEALLDFLRTQ